MTMSLDSIEVWLHAMEESTREMAEQSLTMRTGDSKPVANYQEGLMGLSGSFISMASPHVSVQIGLISNSHGLQYLAKGVLNMSPTHHDLSDVDVADAVGEIVNIIAGGIKRRLSQPGTPLALGLPIFVQGAVEQGQSLEATSIEMPIGDITARLLVFKKRPSLSD